MTDRAPLPYDFMPAVPSFELRSDDVADGQMMSQNQVFDGFGMTGRNISPSLSWSGFPAQRVRLLALDRRRYPRLGDQTPTGAGNGTGEHLPAGAFHLPNDARLARFIGGGPPPGDGRHRYVIVVQATGIERIGQLQLPVQADSTPALLGFSINISGHLLGRAVMIP